MHTSLVILAGLLLGAVFALLGHLWGGAPGTAVAVRAFIPVWLALAAVNLWIGVSRAGYTVAQELPILALVAAVPAGAAVFLLYRIAAN